VLLLAACTPGPFAKPRFIQLGLGGDRACSDPVFGQLAAQCCIEHDNAFWAGGTVQDFHLANAEFLACQLLWGVDPEVAYARWGAVERGGLDSWTLREQRTRGPAR
jgi:hypothetical protein